MIDFQNASYVKLGAIDPAGVLDTVGALLVPGEQVHYAFRGVRDLVVFTDRRAIAVNVQGVTGRKKDLTSLPYSRVQAFSVETAGTFDIDAELELWFSGLGKVRFEFRGRADLAGVARVIGARAL